MKTNIALVGFMGVGKSVIGKELSRRTGKTLVDIDSLIVSQTGKSIPQIFQDVGESGFRKLEAEAIKSTSSHDNQIIACGGGAVLDIANVERLQKNSIIVWLTASPEVIAKRTKSDGDGRPLLQGKNTIEEITKLLKIRDPYYKAAADIIIDTSNSNIAFITEQIMARLKENADYNP